MCEALSLALYYSDAQKVTQQTWNASQIAKWSMKISSLFVISEQKVSQTGGHSSAPNLL